VEKKRPENKKVFIGGLPKGLSEEEFRAYFEKYGELSDYAIICDKKSKEPRGQLALT
jgi:RNA-binding protein Musashi